MYQVLVERINFPKKLGIRVAKASLNNKFPIDIRNNPRNEVRCQ